MGASTSCPCLGRDTSSEDPCFVVIVPFRDEGNGVWSAALERLIVYFEIQRPPNCRLLIIEQSCDGKQFNRGQLLNAGFLSCLKQNWPHPETIVFQDLDMFPNVATLRTYASKPEAPVRVFDASQAKYMSDGCFGGVIAVSPAAFTAANGFPNTMWGWGGENGAFQTRMRKADIAFAHSFGEFERQELAAELVPMTSNEKRWRLTADKRRWRQDGLSTTQFSVVRARSWSHGDSVWCVHHVVELASTGLLCGKCGKWQPESSFSKRQANQRGPAENTVCMTCLADEHKLVEANVSRNSDEARRSCEECGQVFSSRSQLFRHLPVCQQGVVQEKSAVCSPPVSASPVPVPVPDKTLGDSGHRWVQKFARRLKNIASNLVTEDCCTTAAGSEILLQKLLCSQKITCQSKRTNVAQLQSLLARVADLIFIVGEYAVLELGAGKALFTRAMYESLSRRVPVIALDAVELTESRKASFFDPTDVKSGEAPYTRIITDVREAHWMECAELKQPVVAVTKHLCAGATDAALTRVCDLQLVGVCMAPCCHQKLLLADYCNRDYLDKVGLGAEKSFRTLLILLQISCHKELKRFEYQNQAFIQAFPFEEVKLLGQLARRILEEGRAQYLRDRGFEVKVVRYIDEQVTPDNLIIVAHKPAAG